VFPLLNCFPAGFETRLRRSSTGGAAGNQVAWRPSHRTRHAAARRERSISV